MKRILALLFLVLMMAGIYSIQALADTPISTISLDIKSDLQIGAECSEQDIEITVKKGSLSVGSTQILNGIQQWEGGTTPKLSIYLHAEEGYYFSVARKDIEIKGGTYVNGRLVNSNLLELTVTLPSMTTTLGDVGEAWWNSSTEAGWDKVENTGYYEVCLYRNDKAVGGFQNTVETNLDFGNLMDKEGNYRFKVRAVNMRDEAVKSKWVEVAQTSYIDTNMAWQLRNQYGTSIPEGVTEPSQIWHKDYASDQCGWIQDKQGWWYRNLDGSYTAGNWQMIDNKWYYFNSEGYMVTGWIEWNDKSYYCDPSDGAMQVSKIIPDGSGRRVDSTGAWIQ